jgi:lactoylglutathione lyase
MINIKGIDHLNITVKNLDKAIEFYKEFFGFEVIKDYEYEDNEQTNRFLLIGKPGIAMLCLYERPGAELSTGAFAHLGFNVDNFEESYKVAKENNFLDPRWGLIDYEKSRSFYIIDPNGLGVEISEKFTGGY